MKILLKIFGAVLAVAFMIGAVWYFTREPKVCCLCSSPRCHAPCLIDLETGEIIELELYVPHETKVAELADPQPQMETFSFVSLGNVKGTKQTDSKTAKLDIPRSEKTVNPALCKKCRKQLGGFVFDRYVLADLYNSEDKVIIPIKQDLFLELRCYEITAHQEDDLWKVMIQGNLY